MQAGFRTGTNDSEETNEETLTGLLIKKSMGDNQGP